MNNKNTKQDSEVYFLGKKEDKELKNNGRRFLMTVVSISVLVILVIFLLFQYFSSKNSDYYFEPESEIEQSVIINNVSESIKSEKGYIEILEETINDVPLYIHIPHYSELKLQVGKPEKNDSTIIYIAQAADIRADNMEIVGDFVLEGKQLAHGVAKAGFCAIIDGEVTLGVSKDTPLLQKAVESKGFFFRQYPLVNDGKLVENNPKNKSIRRAIAIRNHQVVMIESRSNESFHDFSQALIDVGVSDAIYLVGSTSYGWFYDQNGRRHEFGIEKEKLPISTSYLVWYSN